MVTLRVRLLKGFLDKSIGLTRSAKAYPVYFTTRFGIHTLGMKFPIDVIVLNNNNQVMKTAENLKPNRFFFWPPIYNRVVELPSNTIKKLRVKKEDKIKLEITKCFYT
ncbi:hypothetical protein A2960_04475 [Candidatus Gottesmanbacteria bacterium RIFCSPLOWO2_01_FULL_39_12b]|uniref:DUF192 domain-containing protein n=1 Tax=Candidatus Gottesmanbacteria bacterium RIFCSPLOWO2_01_FULL_39_12b TaxID=1798388 RepID=A0A1F6ANE4_9BACT|nr:MAG: hypothetical protein A2960_04475 [Candidatus Gottesmanbacteria bacterium RIFCSPLOWO2_01_FULL_39_12b]